jgi:threonine/homoserine/homoserine lactone efflux protein
MLVGATSPKTVIFMAAILPQFVDRGTGSVPLQILVLGAIFFVNAVISYSRT